MNALRPKYLTGEHVYLRALTKEDAAVAMAWRQSPYPISQFQAEKNLEQMHENPWQSRQFTYAICRVENDDVVGSVRLGLWHPLRSYLTFKTADWLDREEAARFGAEALKLALEWQSGENERPIVMAIVPAWEEAMLGQAEALGMERVVRLRQHVVRDGCRHDLYICQYIRPDWVGRLTDA